MTKPFMEGAFAYRLDERGSLAVANRRFVTSHKKGDRGEKLELESGAFSPVRVVYTLEKDGQNRPQILKVERTISRGAVPLNATATGRSMRSGERLPVREVEFSYETLRCQIEQIRDRFEKEVKVLYDFRLCSELMPLFLKLGVAGKGSLAQPGKELEEVVEKHRARILLSGATWAGDDPEADPRPWSKGTEPRFVLAARQCLAMEAQYPVGR
jgi:hypothetical protein